MWGNYKTLMSEIWSEGRTKLMEQYSMLLGRKTLYCQDVISFHLDVEI